MDAIGPKLRRVVKQDFAGKWEVWDETPSGKWEVFGPFRWRWMATLISKLI